MKMSKIRLFFALLSSVGWIFSGVFVHPVRAIVPDCKDLGVNYVTGSEPPASVSVGDTVTFTVLGLKPNEKYSLKEMDILTDDMVLQVEKMADSSGRLTFKFLVRENLSGDALGNLHLDIFGNLFPLTSGGDVPTQCALNHDMKIIKGLACETMDVQISQDRGGNQCFWGDGANGCLESTSILVEVTNIVVNGAPYSGDINIKAPGGNKDVKYNGRAEATFDISDEDPGSGTITVKVGKDACDRNFAISSSCGEDVCATEEEGDDDIPLEEAKADPYFLCNQLPQNSQAKVKCLECATGGGAEVPGDIDSRRGIWTAVGCIKREPESIVYSLITIGLGMGGGIALLMILGAGFLISTSQGDVKKVSDAKELITAAVTGLLFIIFSVVMLEFIGYSVFRLPGFGG